MIDHLISGIRHESLSSQLAGLGLFRLLAEQADSRARCWFDGPTMIIRTAVENLASWLVDEYVPTPVLSPWNEGSGFGAKDKAPKEALARLTAISSQRLEPFRRALAVVTPIADQAREQGWPKQTLIAALRGRCPDAMLPWMDAAIIALEDKPAYPPLLGSGGNDGRLEFSTNFHQRLLEVLPTSSTQREASLALAASWISGQATTILSRAAIGQFAPGAAGTPNSSPFGAAESLVNPWEFVLMIEGVPFFAAAPARKLSAQVRAQQRAAMPFMTFGSEFGMTTGAETEESRGEVWLPWWERPLSYSAVRQLFTDGRAVWRGRTAIQSSQMYLATASRGVSPDVAGFDRYAIVKRNGLAFSAVLADEVRTTETAAVRVVEVVEDWVDQVARRSDLPGTVRTPLRRFDAARVEIVRASTPRGQVLSVRELLASLTDLELAVSRSGHIRNEIRPWPRRRTAAPLAALFESSPWRAVVAEPETRTALGLASVVTAPLADAPAGRTLREILLPIDPPTMSGESAMWRATPIVAGFGTRGLADVLCDVTTWLTTDAPYDDRSLDRDESQLGVTGPRRGIAVPWQDLHDWARGQLDDSEIEAWLRAFLALDWRDTAATVHQLPGRSRVVADPCLAILAAFRDGVTAPHDESKRYALQPEWIAQLSAGHVHRAHDQAAQRLHQLGRITPRPTRDGVEGRAGKRIAAALLPRSPSDQPLSAVTCSRQPAHSSPGQTTEESA
jgi:CRISPR-associated protein Csx17